jgi:hypothetical protein
VLADVFSQVNLPLNTFSGLISGDYRVFLKRWIEKIINDLGIAN